MAGVALRSSASWRRTHLQVLTQKNTVVNCRLGSTLGDDFCRPQVLQLKDMTVLETVASRGALGRAAKLISTGERTPGLIIEKREDEPSSWLCSTRPSFLLETVWDKGKSGKEMAKWPRA